ncbi:DUF805 domain-containing protein [Paraburkholderia bannensis]|uniref:DUF805 domain-containing protein n=1 Tax=Paraburkholderia bannensis TaxID=765414 RepID=UPI002ABD9403|nr:DUF805 domain-containing protein [Paraburkholderia bannensis]
MERWLERRFKLAGRATRREYAATMLLFCTLILLLDSQKDSDALGNSLASAIFGVVIIGVVFWIPIAVIVRRLHDIGLSGWWWWLMICVPFGQIGMLLLLFIGPDHFAQTRFYPNPRKNRANSG